MIARHHHDPEPSGRLGLRFLGVGTSQALALGSSAALIEAAGRPILLIDCGPDTLDAFASVHPGLPPALFVTHAHLDHIGGLEGLFYRLATTGPAQPPVRLFVPVDLVAVLQRRLADYPNLLAEGGMNFWDVFQLVPVSERFWYRGLRFTVFPVRHHDHRSAFGLGLDGCFLYTGDTRPIPEVLHRHAGGDEWIFHDCGRVRNPSHTGADEIRVEYGPAQWRRMVFYHYGSRADGEAIERLGLRIARRGQCFDLGRSPLAAATTRPVVAAGDDRVSPTADWQTAATLLP